MSLKISQATSHIYTYTKTCTGNYSEMIMQNLEEYSKIKVGGHKVNNLRYSADTVLITEIKEDLQ